MLLLDLKNVQETVFEDHTLRKKLPDFRSLFDSWTLSRQIPALRQLGKRSILDFMELVESEHIKIISEHVGMPVFLDHIDYHIVKEVVSTTNDLENVLNEVEGYENFSVSRSDNEVILTFWR
jgi:hypothetical protein